MKEINLDNIRRSCERGLRLAERASEQFPNDLYYSRLLDQFAHTLSLVQELKREYQSSKNNLQKGYIQHHPV